MLGHKNQTQMMTDLYPSMNGGVYIVLPPTWIHIDDRVVEGGGGLVVPEYVDVFRRFLDGKSLNLSDVFDRPLTSIATVCPVEVLSRVMTTMTFFAEI